MTTTTDTKKKPARLAAAAKLFLPRLVGIGTTFGVYLIFSWVLTVALRHSAGVGVPWFPLAVLIQFGTALVRMLAEHVSSGIAKGSANGKHEAELAHTVEALKAAYAAGPDALAGLFGKSGAKGADTGASFGNYL